EMVGVRLRRFDRSAPSIHCSWQAARFQYVCPELKGSAIVSVLDRRQEREGGEALHRERVAALGATERVRAHQGAFTLAGKIGLVLEGTQYNELANCSNIGVPDAKQPARDAISYPGVSRFRGVIHTERRTGEGGDFVTRVSHIRTP